MPTRVEIPVTLYDRAGISPPAQIDSDMTNGHYLDGQDGTVVLEVENTDVADQTITLLKSPTLEAAGMSINDEPGTIPAGEIKTFGPWPTQAHLQDPATMRIYIDVSADSVLKLRAYKTVHA